MSDPKDARTLCETAAVPAALAAFLRGIERRGAVFAELQCGDARRGDAALAASMRALHDGAFGEGVRPAGAAGPPGATWRGRFWALLLAAPTLRHPVAGADWPVAFAALSTLGSGPRAALLLRLVAGLEAADAAAVLGIAQPSYRLALQRAAPRRADGALDETAWHALAEASQQAIRQLPPARLAHLAHLREAALQPRRPTAALPRTAPRAAQPRWLRPSLWTGLAVCMLGLAASFVLPMLVAPSGAPSIQRVPLPPAEAPAATFDAQTKLLTDPDFDMLLAADAAALASTDVGFLSWYAAQRMAAVAGAAATPAPVPVPASVANPAAPALESSDAPL